MRGTRGGGLINGQELGGLVYSELLQKRGNLCRSQKPRLPRKGGWERFSYSAISERFIRLSGVSGMARKDAADWRHTVFCTCGIQNLPDVFKNSFIPLSPKSDSHCGL